VPVVGGEVAGGLIVKVPQGVVAEVPGRVDRVEFGFAGGGQRAGLAFAAAGGEPAAEPQAVVCPAGGDGAQAAVVAGGERAGGGDAVAPCAVGGCIPDHADLVEHPGPLWWQRGAEAALSTQPFTQPHAVTGLVVHGQVEVPMRLEMGAGDAVMLQPRGGRRLDGVDHTVARVDQHDRVHRRGVHYL
jgi:hypothetical protein